MVDFEADIRECLVALRAGGVILYPTDTVWGLGCDATDPAAVEKIYRIKQRADEKAMIALVADERAVLQYAASPDLSLFDYLQQAGRPTTVIYPGAIGLADNLTGADGSIAMRICQDAFCRHLLRRFGKPVVSTSANISGQPAPGIYADIDPAVKAAVDYVVQYRQDDMERARPSAIIRWHGNGQITLIRE